MINGFDTQDTLTRLEPFRGSEQAVKRIACLVAVVLGMLLSGNAYAYAPMKTQIQIKTMTPKMYAKSKLPISQYKCALELYTKESNWRPNAKNGPHYGIPQGRSIYLKDASPLAQVRWGIRYSYARYGNMCNALHHFNVKGWH
jgi:hypothetical protein